MEISFIEIFVLIGIIHGFTLGLIILFSRFFKNKDNAYLGYGLIILSIVGMNNWFWDLGENPFIVSILDLFLWQFLYPVILYTFFLKKVKHPFVETSKIYFLYIPFIALSFINIIISLDTIFGLYDIDLMYKKEIIYYFYKIISACSVLFPIILMFYSYKYVFYAKMELDLKWIKLGWIFISLLEIYGVILEGYRLLYGDKMPVTFLWVVVSIFTYWLIYKGLFQFKLSNDQYEIKQLLKRSVLKKTNDEPESENPYIQQLITLIEQEYIHQNPDLSRDIAAKRLGISSGYLSKQFALTTDVNFSEFINRYRIKDIKRMILDPEFDKYSLLAIGLEAGFKSKTTFYTTFKKETGMSPNAFKKLHR
ncbi:helix-turn-helix domain-containing protein [Aquimarina sp. 2201CG5-10]|uniref:AraC family transcriptional regulator n=1 Tax=Aquimarina callyspongiae TaxID=3098150 RepID=UPI002AB48B8F|nr:helix-turn-helix domain-containing protein [Aquimarina sp. 2201CG5-10]MDY8134214.1 helix-turn-helix domain-containing protein [Aquimarina sp. 2201CG5-10]